MDISTLTKTVVEPNFKRTVDGNEGLLVAVAVHAHTDKVLMVAFANKEALLKTLATGMATFYTTSRGRLWTKGEESGNFMKVVKIEVDCDGDSLLYYVEPQGDGLACHTGAPRCFYRPLLRVGAPYKPPHETDAEKLGTMTVEVDIGIKA